MKGQRGAGPAPEAPDALPVQLPHLGDAGQGLHRKLPHLGDAGRETDALSQQVPHLSGSQGVQSQGVQSQGVQSYLRSLAARLRGTRVACGDWSRVCGDSVTWRHGLTGVFLDPPYADTAGRTEALYSTDCHAVAHAVREWSIERGDDPMMRIALCGYEGEHDMPSTWECVAWKAKGGYSNAAKGGNNGNAKRERIWFSPACLRPSALVAQADLFAPPAA
jgi:hypothetical protein